MAVRIRMKKMGRRHRPFYRICAVDGRAPRDGRVLEELGTYDPMIPDTDARAILKSERIQYWISVGAQPSDKVAVLIKKYADGGTHVEKQKAALDRLVQARGAAGRRAATVVAATPAEVATETVEAPAPEAPAPEAPAAETPAPEAPAPEAPAAEAPAPGTSPKPEAPASEAPGAKA